MGRTPDWLIETFKIMTLGIYTVSYNTSIYDVICSIRCWVVWGSMIAVFCQRWVQLHMDTFLSCFFPSLFVSPCFALFREVVVALLVYLINLQYAFFFFSGHFRFTNGHSSARVFCQTMGGGCCRGNKPRDSFWILEISLNVSFDLLQYIDIIIHVHQTFFGVSVRFGFVGDGDEDAQANHNVVAHMKYEISHR